MINALLSLLFLTSTEFVGQEPKPNFVSDPSVIHIALVQSKDLPDDKGDSSDCGPYEAGSRISFRVDAINTAQEPVRILILEPFLQNRPELFRDGDRMGYRDGLSKTLDEIDREPPRSTLQTLQLAPAERKRIGYVELGDWYGPLEPGHYQLSLKARLNLGQTWIESGAITFDVTPKKRKTRTSPNRR